MSKGCSIHTRQSRGASGASQSIHVELLRQAHFPQGKSAIRQTSGNISNKRRHRHFFYQPCCVACGTAVPQPGAEPGQPKCTS